MTCEQANTLYKVPCGKRARPSVKNGEQDDSPYEADSESTVSTEEVTYKLKKMKGVVRVRPYRLAFESPLFNRLLLSAKQLRHYVQFQRYLPHDLGSEFFINIIKSSDYDLIQAENNLKKYFYARQNDKFLFSNRDPLMPENKDIFTSAVILPLPENPTEKYPVFLAGLSDHNPKLFTLRDAMRLFFITVDLLIHEPFWHEGKFDILLDGTGLTLNHFQTFQDQETVRHIKSHMEDSYVPSIMNVHCINVPIPIIQSIRLFRNSKSAPKIFIHDSLESLQNFLSIKILPDEYGGGAGGKREMIDKWRKYVIGSKEWIMKEENNRKEEFQKRNSRDMHKVHHLLKQQEIYDRELGERLKEMQQKDEKRMQVQSEPEMTVAKTKKNK